MGLTLQERARKVHLILLDVDGVQTDRGIYMGSDGIALRRFDVRDGTGITVALDAGLKVAFLSGKSSPSIRTRAEELGVVDVFENLENKLGAYETIKAKYGVSDEEVAYLADDVIDLPVLCRVGLPMAVADAATEVLEAAARVMICPGGHGAVREAIEFIMHAQGNWNETLKARYGL